MYPSTPSQWWLYLSQSAISALEVTGLFACAWLWLNRKNIRAALQTAIPQSLRFNVIALLFDTVLILLPLTRLLEITQSFLLSNRLVLPWATQLAHEHSFSIIFLAVFAGDLVGYFRHRLEHSRMLWPAHVMHHSDTHMFWLTVYRFHPINRLTTVIIDSSCLIILGFPPVAVAISGLFRNYYGMFIHTRLPWTYGRLGRIFVSPAMHRWHHVLEGKGVGSNFASVFALFDRAFGTYYVPGPCNKALGVSEVNNDAFLEQLAFPATCVASLFTSRKSSPAASERLRT